MRRDDVTHRKIDHRANLKSTELTKIDRVNFRAARHKARRAFYGADLPSRHLCAAFPSHGTFAFPGILCTMGGDKITGFPKTNRQTQSPFVNLFSAFRDSSKSLTRPA
jgi:hypothetical protein